MERRAFLAGLLGIAGTAALASAAHAVPLARKELPGFDLDEIDDAVNGTGEAANDAAAAGTTPDGTPVEQAQYWRRRDRRYNLRRWRRGRRYYRRRWRTVCRRVRYRGRWVRRCFRVRRW
jgi:hypothetical protein